MSSRWFARLLLGTVAGVLLSAAAALADPSDRVARISFVGGSVSFRPASLDEWSLASLNYPLTTGDHVWTDRGARIELQLGATVVRIAPLTEFSLLNLDDHTAQLRITQGAVSVRVRTLGADDVLEIDTPNGAVSVLRPGLYRVDVNEAGDVSTVTVREGEADVAAGPTAFPVRRDESAILTGVDVPQSTVRAVEAMDDFDDWALTRDRRADAAQSTRYVSPDMIGYEDLDANGTWEVVGEYGSVWRPNVPPDWVPYRFGYWAWVDPWGWTWIDDAPWGFAPFHYGRWAFLPARGWAWVPGTRAARPVYAPALVAFVGGSNWNVSVRLGSGPIGWFPLGPREIYVPAYQATPEYIQHINASHVTNLTVTNLAVTNISYVNRAVPGAVTAVSRDTFVQARPVAAGAVAISPEQARVAAVLGTASVAPQRESIAGVAAATRPPAAAVARPVVVRRAPPPAAVSFAAKQAALAQHPGQPVDGATETAIRARAPQATAPNPLVRATAPPRPASGSQPAPNTPQAPVRTAGAPAPAAASSNSPVTPSGATATAPSATPAAATRGANPAGRQVTLQAAADLAARQSQERTDIDTRQAQERAALQAKHAHEEQLSEPSQRAQLQKRDALEMKALQDRHKQERDALLKRQQQERQGPGSNAR